LSLDDISDKIIYLSDTIDDFQTYFRPDREVTTITLYELFDKVNTLVAARLEASDVSIHMIRNEDIELKVYINELIQVLLNLVNNSIDALESVDRLQKNVYLYAKLENDRVNIYVQDNGCGIIEKNIQHLFEPYFSTKGKNGTGLGLYMSQMIVQKQFGGDIAVKSSENGTTFIVNIPQYLG
jgi:C4-dicarboxylate-specific signal transduction histidine kinase